MGTIYTQCVHRIRFRPVTPNYEVIDLQVTPPDFKHDQSLRRYHAEHETFDEALEYSFDEDNFSVPTRKNEDKDTTNEVQHLIRG